MANTDGQMNRGVKRTGGSHRRKNRTQTKGDLLRPLVPVSISSSPRLRVAWKLHLDGTWEYVNLDNA